MTGTIEESNDSKPIDFEYHTAVEGAEGHAEGTIETEEDSIHVDLKNRHMKIQNIMLMLLNMKKIQPRWWSGYY
ncbi:fibronectin binding protein B precursor [Staphylococcus aureus]|uniref:Fibronectin binding protein B n=1 Tax=Staphylococcus aureus TaxID=1280 RepID=A0A380EPR0_STAAU|nr:fibronectin binding protein B precursor [Staphylococcus aureus]